MISIFNLAVRPSPTSRSLQRAAHLAHVHSTRPPFDPMFAKAHKTFKANEPPGRNALAKQLFPSSSPAAPVTDIRDQLKKPVANANSVSASASSARTAPFSKPLQDRSSGLMQQQRSMTTSSSAATGSLATLYTNSDSFKDVDVVDLTGPDTKTKAKIQEVYFEEDDFSDDADLDLDFKPPSGVPVLPDPKPKPIEEDILPSSSAAFPPATQPLDWSSSPTSHYFPPQPLKTAASLKRDSSGESEMTGLPAPKKKRVLPASFRSESSDSQSQDAPAAAIAPPTKPPRMWDAPVSAINEQKKQFKIQQATRSESQGLDEQPPQFGKSHDGAKGDAIHLSKEQEHVLDLVVNQGKSVFFTGPAGTGKSVLMRAIINQLRTKYARDRERVAVTASTGLAACNIGGITLHSFSGIGLGKEDAATLVRKIRRNPKAKNRWLRTKCLIIDEISMVDGDLFDKLSQIGRTIRNNGRPWGGIQLIITGDFFQLPPVPDGDKKREAKFAFDAATWSTSIDHTIGLTQVFRQRDPKFAAMLNEMRLGQITQDTVDTFKRLARPLEFNDGVESAELFPTRAQVDGSNERRLRDLPGAPIKYDAIDTGDVNIRDKLLANMMAPKSIELKMDSQVMLIKNLDGSLVNGSLGRVIAFSDERTFDMTNMDDYDPFMDDAMAKARRKLKAFSREPDPDGSGMKYPVVRFISTDGVARVILCQPEEWKVELPNGEVQAKRVQLPLILAWALSIHKAQGQTLERVTVNLGRVFEKGQAYVALSRATSQEGLRVLGFDKNKVMAHPRVITFYRQLYSAEEAAAKRPNSIADFITNRKGVVNTQVREVVDLDSEEERAMAY
ncbi:putative mitochondrial DNA helicase (Pif1) [Trichoderma guizhouense]|uniref:ATP-dependent DNA helicase PIF1 n=1 Tax=Trichoderma guizhouense TaxID=1491466 RepID=A0A1T3CVP8_9HYPO|nr:putative mitochondrial DNA helicase (Pif1) [Trichoderma guizhouense]